MKKFMFLYQGWGEPTDEVKQAWGSWFAKIADNVVDGGSPFGGGREVTPSGSKEMPQDSGATTGYTIVNADSMDDAEKLLADCPIMTGVHIYEAMPM